MQATMPQGVQLRLPDRATVVKVAHVALRCVLIAAGAALAAGALAALPLIPAGVGLVAAAVAGTVALGVAGALVGAYASKFLPAQSPPSTGLLRAGIGGGVVAATLILGTAAAFIFVPYIALPVAIGVAALEGGAIGAGVGQVVVERLADVPLPAGSPELE